MTDKQPTGENQPKADREKLDDDLRRMARPDREIKLPDDDNEGAGEVTHLVP